MKKIQLKISGMHRDSCALLIEEKLKNLSGVIKPRVSYDSGKGVIIYDESKTNEAEIREVIEKIDDYKTEKTQGKEETEKENFSYEKQTTLAGENQQILKSLKTLTGLIVISLGLNVLLAINLFKHSSQKELAKTPTAQVQAPTVLKQEPLPLPPQPIEQPQSQQAFEITKTNHVRGDFNAPISLVEFSDFECPFCERHFPTLNKILNDYKGKVRLVYKHYPLPFHPNAQKAAEASECADEQGKFWEYHDKIFENQPAGLSLEKFKQWAKDLKLNSAKFDDCLISGKYAGKVKIDYDEGTAKGVNGTPATFVNGKLISGAVPYDSFKQVIDGLLK